MVALHGSDNEIEDFYKEIDQSQKLTKPNEINILMGDFNTKVGRTDQEL